MFWDCKISNFSRLRRATITNYHLAMIFRCISIFFWEKKLKMKILFYFAEIERTGSETLKNGVYVCRSRPQAEKKWVFRWKLWKCPPPLVRVGVENKGGPSSSELLWCPDLHVSSIFYYFLAISIKIGVSTSILSVSYRENFTSFWRFRIQ